jgi:hypothetical protein
VTQYVAVFPAPVTVAQFVLCPAYDPDENEMVYPAAWAAASSCAALRSVSAVCGLNNVASEARGSDVPAEKHTA